MAAVAVKHPAFQELGAEILVVSTDTINSHSEWQEKVLSRMVPGGAKFPLISDASGAIGSLYGVYNSEFVTEMRSHFIIDPDGIIQSLEMLAASVGRNVAEILRQLRALIHNRSTGEMMPCGWEPGKPTLPEKNEPTAQARPWESWKPRNAF
jgi:peroxiredoxin (alkyl hydroperoxide reductase subunit C)